MDKRNWKVSSQENLPDWVNELGKKSPFKLTDDERQAFADYINSDEYRAKSVNELTFEDWLSGDFPKQLQHLNEPFKQKGLDIDGQHFNFSVSELEFSKIEAHRRKVFEEIYTGYFDRLCEDFSQRNFTNKREQADGIRIEKNIVTSWLNDEKPIESMAFKTKDGQKYIMSPFFDDLIGNDTARPKCHKLYLLKISSIFFLHTLIAPTDNVDGYMPDCVMVQVLSDYLDYLERLEAKPFKQYSPTRTLETCFKEGEFDRWLNALKDCELATEKPDGSWSLGDLKGVKGHTIRAIWDVAQEKKLLREKLPGGKIIVNAFEDFFKIKLSPDTFDESLNNPSHKVYKNTLSIVKKSLDKAL